MCRICEELVQEEEIRIILHNRKRGISDETIAEFLGRPLAYVQELASPKVTTS